MIRAMFVSALFLSTAVALSQSGNTIAAGKLSAYAELLKIPTKAVVRSNPLEHDTQAAMAGRKLFELHCAECHGLKAQGGRKAPSLLADEVQQASPGVLFWILTNGVVRRGMPVWSKLPEPQRWQLVTYIKSLRPQVEGNSKLPSSQGDARPE